MLRCDRDVKHAKYSTLWCVYIGHISKTTCRLTLYVYGIFSVFEVFIRRNLLRGRDFVQLQTKNAVPFFYKTNNFINFKIAPPMFKISSVEYDPILNDANKPLAASRSYKKLSVNQPIRAFIGRCWLVTRNLWANFEI